ncbi:MAG: phosphomannomutase/phosphoglucomutase, partial [Firmicutes bacterium]|nr:phosphomannomutase/phosphoglucomutase [Bacillota bacterium]
MKDYRSLQNGSDIRGVAMEVPGGKPVDLTDDAVRDLAAGFAKWLRVKYPEKDSQSFSVAVGRDSRLTGEHLQDVFCDAMASRGFSVLDCGMATTPAMFMATVSDEIEPEGAVMITASHLPSERNGLKFFTREGGLDKKDITEIIRLAGAEVPITAEDAEERGGCSGSIYEYYLMDYYAIHLKRIICKGLGCGPSIDPKTGREAFGKPLAGLHIAVDAGNGAGGFYVTEVLEPLGADCTGSQFLEPDGTFPNHIPNPENKAAMESICAAVKTNGADLGIIFDTDVDRSAAVDEHGREIGRNRIVALAAVLASEGHPGTTIVTDSITSTQLGAFLTKELGLKHLRFKRGYKNVINKGLELNAAGEDCQLAIETSGHAAMKENYFLDDGAYLATRIVIKAAQLKKQGLGISSLL